MPAASTTISPSSLVASWTVAPAAAGVPVAGAAGVPVDCGRGVAVLVVPVAQAVSNRPTASRAMSIRLYMVDFPLVHHGSPVTGYPVPYGRNPALVFSRRWDPVSAGGASAATYRRVAR